MTKQRVPKGGRQAPFTKESAPRKSGSRDGPSTVTSPSAIVLEEGRHHAVLDKPAGVTVVRARGVPGKTLLDVAEERYGKGVRPVHRLDKPTTGCCVIARTEYGQQALSDAFRRHLVDKRYLALITGIPPWSKMAVDARLLRVDRPDAKKGPLAIMTVDDAGKRALTRVRVLAKGEGVSLVEARPETGRMHQIRVHLAHVGFPLAGDPLYGDTTARNDDDDGLLLHAWAISFPSPDGGRRFVTAPLPKRFRDRLQAAGIDVNALLANERDKFLPSAKVVPDSSPRRAKEAPREERKPSAGAASKDARRGPGRSGGAAGGKGSGRTKRPRRR